MFLYYRSKLESFMFKFLLKDALNAIGYEKMYISGKIYFVCLMYFFGITASWRHVCTYQLATFKWIPGDKWEPEDDHYLYTMGNARL